MKGGGLDLGVQGILGRATLSPLKSPAAAGGDVEEVAKQFEAVMLQQLVSALRRASLAPGQDEDGGNQLVEHLIDEGLATHLARSGGIGLASMIADDARRAAGAGDGPAAASAHAMGELRRDRTLAAPEDAGDTDDDGSFALPSPEELDGTRRRREVARE